MLIVELREEREREYPLVLQLALAARQYQAVYFICSSACRTASQSDTKSLKLCTLFVSLCLRVSVPLLCRPPKVQLALIVFCNTETFFAPAKQRNNVASRRR